MNDHEERRRASLALDARPASVPAARAWLRDLLTGWDRAALLDDAELLVSELVANVVLHAPGPAVVAVAEGPDGVRLEVADSNPTGPVRKTATASGTTGRGLHLVGCLAAAWGVGAREDGPGKVVWCLLGEGDGDESDGEPDLDVDALLASFSDEPVGFDVVVGDAPVPLLTAAKDHLDGLLREFALAEVGADGALPGELVEGITRAARRFGEARGQLRRQLTAAAAQGAERVVLRFSLPVELADAGEDYLRGLAEADSCARDRRLLSLESPVAHRVLREWYVEGLVRGLRDAAAGRPPRPAESFEQRLLRELQLLEQRGRAFELAAKLQRVTGRLAATQTLQEIATTAVEEGLAALGASGAVLTRPGAGAATLVVEAGTDRGLAARYAADPTVPAGPSTRAISTGRPVLVEGREERDEQFPHLAALQPEAVALAAVPLVVAGAVVGALRFTYTSPHVFSASERDYLAGLAAQTAQAVARTDALERLREAEGRSRSLARLGAELARDRSVADVLDAVSAVVLPALGDWLAVHLVDEQGAVWCPLARHRDPLLAPALDELRRHPVTRDQPYGVGRVLATGTTQQVPEVTEQVLLTRAPDDRAVVALLRGLDARSATIVPLVARGRTVGALSVARAGGRALGADDVTMLEDVGRRAGTALDNVRELTTSVRLELALTAASVGSFDWHLASGRLLWDPRLLSMMDLDPADFDGTIAGFFARVLAEDEERTAAAIDRAIRTVGELAVDYRIRLRDGSVRWLEGRGRALPGPDGTAERLVGVAVDVTHQRDVGARALRSLELMADAFVQLDREWVITYVNAEAERLTGRRRDDVLGQDFWTCFPATVGTVFEQQYRAAVATGEPVRFEATAPATGTHLEVRGFPGPEGLALYFTDVGERRSTERDRDRALARLRLLNDVGATLAATLDVDEALTLLAERLVPALADLVCIDVRDEDDVRGGREVVVTAADPARADAMRRADAVLPRRHNPAASVHRVLSGEPYVQVEVTPDYLAAVAADDRQLAAWRDVDMRCGLVVPLSARGRVFGALSLIRTGPDAAPFTRDDVELALEIGRRAGTDVDNAAQYTGQRDVAEGLQRSLLPALPVVPGVLLGAAYEPSSSQAKVGGDWYDAFVLPDGALGLVIGDVMGHDLAAAAATGQLRSALRTCAMDGHGPARVLDRLDHLVTSLAIADLATVVYARLDLGADGTARLSWASAGHPPPLLLAPGAPARFLDAASSLMIGVEAGAPRHDAVQELPAGSTVLLYTDGVVERRDADLDEGLARLREASAGLLAGGDPAGLCHGVVSAARRPGWSDDAAAIAVTLCRP